MDPLKTVIVIRSLVPGGVAERDGRLLPGDRLMYVNNINLESASLEEAVQALKGANMGAVHIGVAKPLPVRNTSLYFLKQLFSLHDFVLLKPVAAVTGFLRRFFEYFMTRVCSPLRPQEMKSSWRSVSVSL